MKWIFLLTLTASVSWAQYDNWYSTSPAPQNVETTSGNFSDYNSNFKLRQDRKVGAGVSVGGPLGAFGLMAELNIEDENSAMAGFGAGSGYQTVSLAWKKSFEGEYFTPYTTAGYARWWDSGSKSESGRSSLLKNFLTDEQKRTNKFGLDLLTGSLGMQYNQLSGEFAGSSFFIEFGGLLSFQNTKILPTGSVGALYYF